jgi:hypothetical protein
MKAKAPYSSVRGLIAVLRFYQPLPKLFVLLVPLSLLPLAPSEVKLQC